MDALATRYDGDKPESDEERGSDFGQMVFLDFEFQPSAKLSGEFTVNIALVDDGRPVLGVVHVPVQDKTYIGCRGLGAQRRAPGSAPVAIRVAARSGSTARIVGSRSHRGASRSRSSLAALPSARSPSPAPASAALIGEPVLTTRGFIYQKEAARLRPDWVQKAQIASANTETRLGEIS